MKRTAVFFLFLFQFILISSVFAQTLAITNGLNYLTSTQNPDGSWGGATSGTESLPSTASVIETFQILSQTGTPNYSSALSWLQTQGLETTDYLSERIHALSVSGTDNTLLLSYLDDLTGAWGGYAGFKVNNLDTLLALQALKKINFQDQNIISQTLYYLTSTQNADGGWGLKQGMESEVYYTALVLNTLSQFKTIYDLKTPINNAVTYLLTKQNPDGGWGSPGGVNPAPTSTVYETSLAFESLLASGAVGAEKAANMQDAVNYITSTQLPNGSWNNDPYSTALALRALAMVKPNLSITSSDITFPNSAPTVGDTIIITANIKNTGPAQAANVLVQFYSGDPASGGTLIGTTTIPSSPAYGSAPTSVIWTIPSAGPGTIYVKVDPLNTIDELNETDNVASKNLTSATLPDLSIASADITSSPLAPLPAEIVAITATIRNNGETGASNFSVDIYDGNPSAGGVNIFSAMVPSIGAGSAVAIQLTTNFTAGSHTIYVVIDKSNTVSESSKTNNTATKTLQIGGTTDLSIRNTDITFTPIYPTEDNIVTVNAVIHNEGDAAANNVLVRFYLGDPDAGGVQIGSEINISALSARGTASASTTWDSTGHAGNNNIYVKIDPLNSISELSKANNKAFQTIKVAAKTGPDLTITSVDINFIPLTPNTGDTVTITARVRNIGTSDANNVLVEFSLGDPEVGGTLIIGSRTIPLIAKGGSALAQITWNTSGISGNYGIYVNADPFNAIAELDEKNNISHGTLEVKAPQGPDLTITSIDTTNLTTDTQALTVSGTIKVTIRNKGNQPTSVPFEITAFEDTNKNKQLDVAEDNILGRVTYTNNLTAGSADIIAMPLSGNILFKDNLIYVVVDGSNLISELNKTNNMRNTGQQCEYKPPVGSFNPVEKWRWTGSAVLPDYNQVMSTPVVANLTDDNGDGLINEKDMPDIIFITAQPGDYVGWAPGVLRAISGDNGRELFTVTDPRYRLVWTATLAVGDIDGDGIAEIIGYGGAGTIAFKHDGTVKWTSPYGNAFWGGISIADIDNDGKPEIIIGATVLNNDGTLKWRGAAGQGSNYGAISLVADIDLDGVPEIVAGNTVYKNDGTILWRNTAIGDGFNAIANFDDDPYPEIVLVTSGKVYLLEHTGIIKWGPVSIPGGGRGGAPTVADFDGDGRPEIGVAGVSRYVVFRQDGSILWQSITQDYSSNLTGSSVFDFDGDGQAEVVYNDEKYLRIYRGYNGQVLFSTPNSSGTAVEYPVIVDVDNDNHAEIVVSSNDYYPPSLINGKGFHGIRVFEDANNNWVNTRKIWNQHAYHITNVNDDGSIPRHEENSWERYNTYRCNSLLPEQALATADLTASYIRMSQATLSARIGNGGAAGQLSPVEVAFYSGDPAAGGQLIGKTATTGTINPGDFQDVSITWNAPATDRAIYVVADPNNLLHECRKDNNIATTAMADLEITSSDIVITPAGITEGQTAVITASVHNKSGQSASNVLVSFYNGDPHSGGVLIGSSTAAFIAAGSSVIVNREWNTAGQSGRNYLYVIADPKGLVQELNKSNNYAFIPVDVTQPAKPDLQIISSDLTLSIAAPQVGDQITVTATIHNIGTAVGPVDVCLYDGDPMAGGSLIACKVISQVIPFLGQATVGFAVKTPGPVGSRRFYVSADPYNKIDEGDKTNNSASVSLTVGKASLGLSVSTDKAAYGAREDVRITVNVTNRSTVINPALKVTIEDSAGNEVAVTGSLSPNGRVFQGWAYRIPTSVSKDATVKDAFARAALDFAQIFRALGVTAWTVDTNSIRVAEVDASGNLISEKQAKALFTGVDKARVIWFMDGVTQANVTRYFQIYFDILENGTKPPSTHATLPVRGIGLTDGLIGFTDGYGKVYVVRNNGDGTFGAAQLVDTAAYTYDFGIAVADFNNDGFYDIITGSGSTGEIFYYQNKADGTDTFLPKQMIGSVTPSLFIMDMAAADFDGDGNNDFVVGGNDTNLYLFKGKGDGTFIKSVILSPPGPNYFRGKAAADFDNDGKMDLVVGSYYGGALYLYKGNGDGTFAAPVFIANIGADPYGVTAGDVDGDGKIDIIATNAGTGQAYLLKGNGDGTFAAPILVPSLATNNYTGLDVGDFNNDGKTDVILGTYTGLSLYYFPGNGDGTFGPKTTIATISSGYLIGISASSGTQGMPAQLGSPEQVPPQTYVLTWNTGTTPAGDYAVHASLTGGQAVFDAYANFVILPDKTIDSKITTDKISYTANQPVTLTSTITSQSMNNILSDLTANIRINAPSGQNVFADTKTITTLVPGQLVELRSYWNTGTNPKGIYTITLQVMDGATVLTTSARTFTILGSAETGEGLTGTLTVSPNPVYQGKDETTSYTVTNKGNEDLAGLNVTVLIVDPQTQTVKGTLRTTKDILMNTTATGNLITSTSSLSPKIYLAVLQASSAQMTKPKTLASSTFEVKPGIEATKKIPDAVTLLVWVNKECREADEESKEEDEEHDRKGARVRVKSSKDDCREEDEKEGGDHEAYIRIDLIEKMLKEAVTDYVLVYDKKDFQRELRNPYYTDVLILGEHSPVEDHYEDELREKVYSGTGIISSLWLRHDDDDHDVNPVFGINHRGEMSGRTHSIRTINSPITTDGLITSKGNAERIEAAATTIIAGWIKADGEKKESSDNDHKETEQYPAITLNEYGKGRAIYLAFDLGATLDDSTYPHLAELIRNSINYVHRQTDTSSYRPEQLVPLQITLKSLGSAFDLKVTETYPAEIKLYDHKTDKWITDNPWIMDIALAPNENRTIPFFALTPDKAGTYTLNTEVGYRDNGNYTFYQTMAQDIVVSEDAAATALDVLAGLNSLQVSKKDASRVKEAGKHIEQVRSRQADDREAIEKNIQDTLEAVADLLQISSTDTTSIRLLMDALLRIWEGKWYLTP